MTLQFLPNSLALTGWGLGLGEIAVIAGAGRQIGTWVMAGRKDRSLFDFLNVDNPAGLLRKGFIDREELHKLWSGRATLFRNGGIQTFEGTQTISVMENLDSFTWFMVLVVAGLEVTVSQSTLHKVVLLFLQGRFSGNAGLVFVEREVARHIEGWCSQASVRSILQAARLEWKSLEDRELHQPGLIPDSDVPELVRLLEWIAGDRKNPYDRVFKTVSTDAFSFAALVRHLGLRSLQATTSADDFDEHEIVVRLDPTHEAFSSPLAPQKRRGMRIPLSQMQEAITLWPGEPDQGNYRRAIFEAGFQSASGTRLIAMQRVRGSLHKSEPGSIGKFDTLCGVVFRPTGRVLSQVHSLAERYLLGYSQDACNHLVNLVQSWKLGSDELARNVGGLLKFKEASKEASLDTRVICEFQIFLLGYYYGLLRPVLDTSRLLDNEGYGSWGWNDLQLLSLIEDIMSGRMFTQVRKEVRILAIRRSDILKLVGYLFGGAEWKQIKAVRPDSRGILAKLSVLDATLLGDADKTDKIVKFHILDIDKTCIPSNDLGIVTSGIDQTNFTREPLQNLEPQIPCPTNLHGQEDFSSQIEPEWEVDSRACLVSFRNRGRIVARLSPDQCYHAILNATDCWQSDSNDYEIYRCPLQEIALYAPEFLPGPDDDPLRLFPRQQIASERVYPVSLSFFEGSRMPFLDSIPGHPPLRIVYVSARSLWKARTCLAGMLQSFSTDFPSSDYLIPIHVTPDWVSSQSTEELVLEDEHGRFHVVIQ